MIDNKAFQFAFCAAVAGGIFTASVYPYQDPHGAKETLNKQGLTDIKTSSERAWFACTTHGFKDFQTKFTAKDTDNSAVEGVVCKGTFGTSVIKHKILAK